MARSRCKTLLHGCAVLMILRIAAAARFLEPSHALPSSSAGLPLAESTWQPLAEASDVASIHASPSSASPKVASGYIRLHRPRPDTDARMFYVFVESRNPTPETPLILWLTGGPGCSGELPLLVEQGPYELEGFNVSTGAGGDVLVRRRRYSWDRQFHLLYLDQPVGTGFSYSTDPHDKAHNERDVSRDVLDFLRQFYAARPGLANTSLFIGGESYAGHYIPPLASAVLRANARRDSSALRIPLRGVAIVNGYFDPGVQYSSMADYVYSNGLISTQLRDSINRWMPLCRGAARLCGLSRWGWACKAAAWACDALSFQRLTRALPHTNWADIRMVCDPASRPLGTPCYYNFSAIHRYWNRPDVQVDGGQRRGAECRL